MASRVYGDVIRGAIERGNLRQMREVLTRARQVQKEQGDLPKAIARLEKAIAKVAKKNG